LLRYGAGASHQQLNKVELAVKIKISASFTINFGTSHKFKGGSKNNREGREGCEKKHENKHLLVL
jgi:hypothetical protein